MDRIKRTYRYFKNLFIHGLDSILLGLVFALSNLIPPYHVVNIILIIIGVGLSFLGSLSLYQYLKSNPAK